jgi:xanthine dehydrogenase YagR molybdenum-binding subunit
MSAVGLPIDRVDGRLKVTGAARYAAEFPVANVAHGVMVLSTIPGGRIASIDTRAAERAAGVLLAMTHRNAPSVNGAIVTSPREPEDKHLLLLQDDTILQDGQPVALVVAETFEQATYAASLVDVQYALATAVMIAEDVLDQAFIPKGNAVPKTPPRVHGDPYGALDRAAVRTDETYRTPIEYHAQMEPHAAIAVWEDERLTVYDSTQGIFCARHKLASVFGVPEANVRVICHYVGGGFGGKGSTGPHQVLAAMAARQLNRPVKIALARPDMFRTVGFRSATVQRVALGAARDGKLEAIVHENVAQVSMYDEFVEAASKPSSMLYACPNIATSDRIVRVNAGTPTFTRAPGESVGSFALESAMDELAWALRMDPIVLRLRNYAEAHPSTGKPWSSKSLRQCYAEGARLFDWGRWEAAPRSMHRDGLLVGLGMATASYPVHSSGASAVARILADGSGLVASGSQELGTGTYTIMSQAAADALGLPVERVRFNLGDTELPYAPTSGGSVSAGSVGAAVHNAAAAVRKKVVEMALADEDSPLHGRSEEDVAVEEGRIVLKADTKVADSYAEILRRHGQPEMEARAEGKYGSDKHSAYAFGAQFAEVRVDAELGTVRVSRFIGVFAGGRILNEKTARSQLMGGVVFGIGMALTEDTSTDHNRGRVMSANLADYLVPVNADVPDIYVRLIDEDDPHIGPLGAKGLGELGITGAAAAIANAVYHATGRRVRDLPITPDKLL